MRIRIMFSEFSQTTLDSVTSSVFLFPMALITFPAGFHTGLFLVSGKVLTVSTLLRTF